MHRGAPTYGRRLTLNGRAARAIGAVDKSRERKSANRPAQQYAAEKSKGIFPRAGVRLNPAIAGRRAARAL